MSTPVKASERERRYKCLLLPEQFIVNMFITDALRPGDCFTRHRLLHKDCLGGMEVVYTSYSHLHMAWHIVLYHPSWPIIDDGSIPPLHEDQTGIVMETFVFGHETEITKSWRHLPSLLGN